MQEIKIKIQTSKTRKPNRILDLFNDIDVEFEDDLRHNVY